MFICVFIFGQSREYRKKRRFRIHSKLIPCQFTPYKGVVKSLLEVTPPHSRDFGIVWYSIEKPCTL